MAEEAILSNQKGYTVFQYNGHTSRFKTSAGLERYTKILEWNQDYLDSIKQLEQRLLRESGFTQVTVTGKTGDELVEKLRELQLGVVPVNDYIIDEAWYLSI